MIRGSTLLALPCNLRYGQKRPKGKLLGGLLTGQHGQHDVTTQKGPVGDFADVVVSQPTCRDPQKVLDNGHGGRFLRFRGFHIAAQYANPPDFAGFRSPASIPWWLRSR